MSTSTERMRAWKGPAVLSYGYRPFFLLGALWAALVMTLWILTLAGLLDWPAAFDPVTWHAHSLLFGYSMALIAGFLMTAVPNWTGRFPIVGWPLAGLVMLWIVGRLAVSIDIGLSPLLVAAIDVAFPTVFALAIGREIVAGRNWRNVKVLALLCLLIVANILFHSDAAQGGYAAGGLGARLALATLILLITLIGGRVVPSFTRNWLAQRRAAILPAAASRFDDVCMAVTATALVVWTALPDHAVTGWLCVAAGTANIVRLRRWQGLQTLSEPLVWVLHMGFLFVALGFFTVALDISGIVVLGAAARHVWLAGAVGLMSLAVMSRASLGHGGYPLSAGKGAVVLYISLIISVLARVFAPIFPEASWLLELAATGWILAFGGFAVLYWPILVHPKRQARQANRAGA